LIAGGKEVINAEEREIIRLEKRIGAKQRDDEDGLDYFLKVSFSKA